MSKIWLWKTTWNFLLLDSVPEIGEGVHLIRLPVHVHCLVHALSAVHGVSAVVASQDTRRWNVLCVRSGQPFFRVCSHECNWIIGFWMSLVCATLFRTLGSQTLWRPLVQSLRGGYAIRHTYVLSHRGPIQAGAEKLGICGSVRGRLGTLGRGTLARLLVKDLPGQRCGKVDGWRRVKG